MAETYDIRYILNSAKEKIILGLDPGDLTGVAVMGQSGEAVYVANIPAEDMSDFLVTNGDYLAKLTRQIVMEDYILYGHKAKAQTGSRFKAIQVIGQVKMWAKMHKIPIATQQARVLAIAEKWSQIFPRGKHKDTHYIDAYNHAFYWAVGAGLAKTSLERQNLTEKEKGNGSQQS